MKVISCILLFLLSFQVFLKIGIIGYYGINRDYITANFCENISKPEMRCNGKCYLKKQIDKADESENRKQAPSRQKDQTEFQSFIFEQPGAFILFSSIQITPDAREANLRSGFTSGLLRPPAV